ncbi:MAG: tetratricopeptide repeat protein, partial [Actinomycetota bacterium]|nr:tetratricopeptide repeat protein [Actinomycetota bacterium]
FRRGGVPRGEALLAAGQFAEAEVALRAELERDPRDAATLVALAGALDELGRHDEAAAFAQRAIGCDPDNRRAYALRGIALATIGRSNSAIAALQRAVALGNDDWYVHNALGSALHRQGDVDDAIAHLRRATRRAPKQAVARSNLGGVLTEAGHYDEGRVEHEAACALEPDNARFRMNRALGALANGEFTWGFEEYDYGLVPELRGERRYPEVAPWDGSALGQQTIVVYREQGLGDELIFGSCYGDLVAEAGHVVIECRGRLVPLFARTFPGATVRATRDQSPIPPVDVAVPAGSVARYRRATLDSFPRQRGYLVPDPAQVKHWSAWLRTLPGTRRGVAWCSGVVNATRRGAYPPLDDWQPVFAVPDTTFVCLQYGDSSADRAVIRDRFGVDVVVPPDLDLRDDLDGVAALAAALDEVVAVDNAVAALGGAVGAPTSVLVPAHSFTALGTDRWPWLPSVRIFERAPGATWEDAMAALAHALK